MFYVIKRCSKEFDDLCVWCPKYSVHKDRIELLHKNVPTYSLRGLNWDYLPLLLGLSYVIYHIYLTIV